MAEYLSAVGIAVADLQVAARFYERALGMTSLQTITLPEMEEIILGFEGTRSAAVILMKYTDGTHIENNDKVANSCSTSTTSLEHSKLFVMQAAGWRERPKS